MKNIDLFGNEEKQTLYVIGNGFDIHHGIDSRYSDFQEFLYKTGKSFLVGQIEVFYPSVTNTSDYNWGDLEMALGDIDYQATYNDCTDDITIDYDHPMQTSATFEDKPQQMLEEALDNLHASFENWVNSIDISCAEKDNTIYQFDANGSFLNFNYTETLESAYGIPSTSIVYIHGRRGRDNELILGHCTDLDIAEAFHEDNMIYEDNAYEGIISIANSQRKNVSEIIASKDSFWKSLTNINRIITYGHSLSDVDAPYFQKILNSIQKNAEWHFGCYNEEDRKKATKLAQDLKIAKQLYCCFKF